MVGQIKGIWKDAKHRGRSYTKLVVVAPSKQEAKRLVSNYEVVYEEVPRRSTVLFWGLYTFYVRE